MRDVVIIGGGPGGLFASVLLAKKGFNVTVLEEHPTTGEPVHCTGVLGIEAYDEFDIPRSAVLNNLTSVQFFSPSNHVVSYNTGSVHAVVIDRKQFDQALTDQAERLGVEILRGSRAEGVQIDADSVRISTTQAELTAKACVLACGANYALQRRLGLGLPPLFLHTAQVEIPCGTPHNVEMHFGLDVAPQGFAWAVPVERESGTFVRVGLMCSNNPEEYFQKFLGKLSDRWAIDSSTVPRPRLKMLPLAPIPKTYLDRLLVIGDAAGLVKPTTGGGIYFSILSASLAANVLISGMERGNVSAQFLGKYESDWQSRLGGEFEAQLKLRRIAQRMDDAEMDSLFQLAQSDGILPLVRSIARFNQHADLIWALLKHPGVKQILANRI